jgi:hypothetical protein
MGYEVRLILGHTWSQDESPAMMKVNKKYGQTINEVARVDLSVADTPINELVHKAQKEAEQRFAETGVRYAIYSDYRTPKGNERKLFADSYGSIIGAIPLAELLPVLKQETEESKKNYRGRPYRRYQLALAMVEIIIDRFPSQSADGRLVALTWGH